jgi:hypothetical protein
MALFNKIVGFSNKKDSESVKSGTPGRDFSDYTTINTGFVFAKSYINTKFLVESWNYSCVDRGLKVTTNPDLVSEFVFIYLFFFFFFFCNIYY